MAHDPTSSTARVPTSGRSIGRRYFTGTRPAEGGQAYIAKLSDAKVYRTPIVTQVSPLESSIAAEDYHQDYLVHHPTQPYIVINDAPKIEELRRQFPALYRERKGPASRS